MDPPVAAPVAAASSLYGLQAAADASAASSSIDHLLLFDDLECDGDAAFTPSVASNGLSIPAHEALMAFLTEMEALDKDDPDDQDEQQSNGGSTSDTTETVESAPETVTTAEETRQVLAGEEMRSTKETQDSEQKPKQAAASKRRRPKTACSTESPAAKPEKKRIRAKQEIDMLREDAAALQRHIEMIRSTSTEKQKWVDAARSTGNTNPKLRHVSAVEQNRQLRKLVKTQLRYAKQIENVLMSKSQDDETHSTLISDNAITQTPLSKADLVVFYEALTGKLDELYMQLDSVFADADPQDSNKAEFNDVKLVIDANKHVTLQLRDMKTLPFSFESVKDVSWRFLKTQSVKEGDGADEFLAVDEDVMLMRRGLTVKLEEGEPEIEIPSRSVSKRFMSKDRMVFCWDGTTDWPIPPKSDGKPGPQSVALREKGWAVIKPVPGAPGFSTLQMCILMTPRDSDERTLEKITTDEIEDNINRVFVPTYRQLFVSRYQMVENMLLDEQKR